MTSVTPSTPYGRKCTFCYLKVKAIANQKILSCKHVFHKACITPWLLKKGTCPTCFRKQEPVFNINDQLKREIDRKIMKIALASLAIFLFSMGFALKLNSLAGSSCALTGAMVIFPLLD